MKHEHSGSHTLPEQLLSMKSYIAQGKLSGSFEQQIKVLQGSISGMSFKGADKDHEGRKLDIYKFVSIACITLEP